MLKWLCKGQLFIQLAADYQVVCAGLYGGAQGGVCLEVDAMATTQLLQTRPHQVRVPLSLQQNTKCCC